MNPGKNILACIIDAADRAEHGYNAFGPRVRFSVTKAGLHIDAASFDGDNSACETLTWTEIERAGEPHQENATPYLPFIDAAVQRLYKAVGTNELPTGISSVGESLGSVAGEAESSNT